MVNERHNATIAKYAPRDSVNMTATVVTPRPSANKMPCHFVCFSSGLRQNIRATTPKSATVAHSLIGPCSTEVSVALMNAGSCTPETCKRATHDNASDIAAVDNSAAAHARTARTRLIVGDKAVRSSQ